MNFGYWSVIGIFASQFPRIANHFSVIIRFLSPNHPIILSMVPAKWFSCIFVHFIRRLGYYVITIRDRIVHMPKYIFKWNPQKKKKKDSPDRCLATVQIRDYPLTKNWIDECAKQCPTMILDQEPFALPSTFPFPYFSLYPNIAVTSVDELRRKKSVGRPDEIWGLSLQRNINVHDDEPTCGKRIYTYKKIRLVVCLL